MINKFKKVAKYQRCVVKYINTHREGSENWYPNGALIIHQSKSFNFLKIKLNEVVARYEEFTGMDEVRLAQNRVLEAEEKFRRAQEERREQQLVLTEIQQKLKDIHLALDTTGRGEDKYVQLITEESKILKQERRLQAAFQQAEKNEREYFANLSASVKESHEKERAQAERTKYWSIIGSILGTVIGVVGSSINNRIKMKELKQLIIDSNVSGEIENLIQTVANHSVKEEVLRLEKLITDRRPQEVNDTDLVNILYSSMEQEKKRTTYCFGVILGISIVVPLVIRFCS